MYNKTSRPVCSDQKVTKLLEKWLQTISAKSMSTRSLPWLLENLFADWACKPFIWLVNKLNHNVKQTHGDFSKLWPSTIAIQFIISVLFCFEFPFPVYMQCDSSGFKYRVITTTLTYFNFKRKYPVLDSKLWTSSDRQSKKQIPPLLVTKLTPSFFKIALITVEMNLIWKTGGTQIEDKNVSLVG